MLKAIRWRVLLAAVALLLILGATPAAAGSRPSLQPERGAAPPSVPALYSGWIEIDVARSWDVPNPAAYLVQNRLDLFVRRFRTSLSLNLGSGSNPPSLVAIASHPFEYYAMFSQRLQPPPEAGDVCRGYFVLMAGKGTFGGYSGSASGSRGSWGIPGIRFTPSPTTPDITFLQGNCEPGRSPLQESSISALQSELSMPGDVQWSFTEGIRTPPSSSAPTSIEGSCDAPVYGQAGGRIQCSWQVRAAAPRLVPPRRR